MKVTGASHTQHHPSHGEEVVWPSLGTLSLPADGDPHGPATLPGSSPDFVLPLSRAPRAPRQEPSRQNSPFPLPGWLLAPAWGGPGCGAGVGFKPLGRWGRMWARPRLPAHLPPSRAQPLPSQASLWTQDQHSPSPGRRPSPVPPRVTHCSPGPQPPLSPGRRQAQGCAEATGSGARGLLSQEGLEQPDRPARRGWPGDSKASG